VTLAAYGHYTYLLACLTKEEVGGRHQTRPQNTDLTWEETEELANDKAEWRRRVAQCSHLDAG